MLYSDSLREMMQNAVNESFWDAHGVEIGACAIFDNFRRSKIFENLEELPKKRKIRYSGQTGSPPLRNYVPGFPSGRTPKVKHVFCF